MTYINCDDYNYSALMGINICLMSIVTYVVIIYPLSGKERMITQINLHLSDRISDTPEFTELVFGYYELPTHN